MTAPDDRYTDLLTPEMMAHLLRHADEMPSLADRLMPPVPPGHPPGPFYWRRPPWYKRMWRRVRAAWK